MFHTLAGVLALLLASPVYDGLRLYRSQRESPDAQTKLDLG